MRDGNRSKFRGGDKLHATVYGETVETDGNSTRKPESIELFLIENNRRNVNGLQGRCVTRRKKPRVNV